MNMDTRIELNEKCKLVYYYAETLELNNNIWGVAFYLTTL